MAIYDLPISGRTHSDLGVTTNADYSLILDLMSDVAGYPVFIFYRSVPNDGRLQDGLQVVTTDGLAARQRTLIALPGGLLTHVSLGIAGDLGATGEVRARVGVGTRGGDNAAFSVLVDGYVGGGDNIQWPIQQLTQVHQGRGKKLDLQGAVPAAGAEAVLAVPAGCVYELETVQAILTTSAVAGSREVRFGSTYVTSALDYSFSFTGINHSASNTYIYTAVRLLGNGIQWGVHERIMPMGDISLNGGRSITTLTHLIDVADQWTAISATVWRRFEF
jgi:hypothetical protein